MEALAIAALIVAAAAFLSWFGAELAKRPRLQIRLATWPAVGQQPFTFAVVNVRNRPLGWALRWFLVRQTADSLESTIEFRRAGESALWIEKLQGRWSGTTEPLKPVGVDVATGQLLTIFDETLVQQSQQIDLAPTDDGHELAVAVMRGDGDAFGWSTRSYMHAEYRNAIWRLEHGVYDVTVTVRASGLSTSRTVQLEILSSTFAAFRTTESPVRRRR